MEGQVELVVISLLDLNAFKSRPSKENVSVHWTLTPSRVRANTNTHEKSPILKDKTFSMEGQVGLEPTTPCLRGRCSNQLSYWPTRAITD